MLADKGITVNCIATGGIHNVYGLGNGIDLDRQIPLDNCSTLNAICKTVSFLIDEAGCDISGEVFFCNTAKSHQGDKREKVESLEIGITMSFDLSNCVFTTTWIDLEASETTIPLRLNLEIMSSAI